MTDPDASLTRTGKGPSTLNYKVHRVVDEKTEIIAATDITTCSVNEAHLMDNLINQHVINTRKKAKIVVANSKYGTIDNYLTCHNRGMKAHMESIEKKRGRFGAKAGVFSPDKFEYDSENDVYLCPAGEQLKQRSFYKKRNHFEYAAPVKVCDQCKLKSQCSRSKSGRTVKRHLRQDDLEQMLSQKEQSEAKKDIATRQSLMERSFARSTRYGFKRARWRRLWNVRIHEYIITAIQNMMVLIKNSIKLKAIGAKQQHITINHFGNTMAYCTNIMIFLRFVSSYRSKYVSCLE